jgi:type IV pilus assembly protein PilM
MQLAGLKPYMMDLVPLALCRVIEQPTAIVVSLRSSNFEIAIMADRVPQVIRSLSLPGEAESLVDKLPTISEELDRTITFYNSSHTDKPLDNNTPVFVDGDLVQAPDSWPSLVGSLGSKVTPLPSIMHAVGEFDASQFTVNIGLVFKENAHEVTGSLINLNALPKAFQPERPKASRVILPVAAGVGVLILVFVWLQGRNSVSDTASVNSQIALENSRITQVNSEIATTKGQITQLQSQVKPLEDQIKTTEASATTFTNLVDNMTNSRNTTNTNAKQIWDLVPSDLKLTSVDLRDVASIQGEAPSETTIFSYARALKDSKIYSSIVIQSIALNEQDVEGVTVRTYQFVIAGQ